MKEMNILIHSCGLCVGIYSNKSLYQKAFAFNLSASVILLQQSYPVCGVFWFFFSFLQKGQKPAHTLLC